MMDVTLSDIAILNIKGSDYWCLISLISKNKAIHLLQNADLTEKSETLYIKKKWYFFESRYIVEHYKLRKHYLKKKKVSKSGTL